MINEQPRMEVKYFIYLMFFIDLLLFMLCAVFLIIGIAGLAKSNNHLLIVVFSICESLIICSLIWMYVLLKLHNSKNYTKLSVIMLFIVSLIGLPIVQTLLWFIHYTNWKITQANIKAHIEKVTSEE